MDSTPPNVANPHASRPDLKKTISIVVLVAIGILVAKNWDQLKALFGI